MTVLLHKRLNFAWIGYSSSLRHQGKIKIKIRIKVMIKKKLCLNLKIKIRFF